MFREGTARALTRSSRLVGASLPLAVQRGLPSLTVVIITILVARNLGVEPVGRFAVLAALIGISRVASDFGFDRYLPRQLISSDDAPQRVIEATAARAVTGAICAFGVVVVGSLLLGPSSEVLVAALVPICATPVIIATSWTLARGTTRVLLPSAIVGFLVTIAIAVASTRGLGLAALFAAMAIGVTTEGALGWRLSGPSAVSRLAPLGI
jgi:hypothetical protein